MTLRFKEDTNMNEPIISEILQDMLPVLDNSQLAKLKGVLEHKLWNAEIVYKTVEDSFDKSNEEFTELFISAKRVEGCSLKTLRYYLATINKMTNTVGKHITKITTEDLRKYLSDYHEENNCSKSNIDNIRRILSSFFSWLEDEDYILKSPVRRIHKIKSAKTVKETYTDEMLEYMRDNCDSLRDLAIIDMLASTGMRVGELVHLNIEDVDFENRECVVLGKGSKERPVYFDARTKIHLRNYLESRNDDNPALFVSMLKPYNRLNISGVEIRLRELGRKLDITKVHPHKFRRTLATRAIDKGMPIEQVQKLLGHSKIDTTMQYAMVDQENVKLSHRKFISYGNTQKLLQIISYVRDEYDIFEESTRLQALINKYAFIFDKANINDVVNLFLFCRQAKIEIPYLQEECIVRKIKEKDDPILWATYLMYSQYNRKYSDEIRSCIEKTLLEKINAIRVQKSVYEYREFWWILIFNKCPFITNASQNAIDNAITLLNVPTASGCTHTLVDIFKNYLQNSPIQFFDWDIERNDFLRTLTFKTHEKSIFKNYKENAISLAWGSI